MHCSHYTVHNTSPWLQFQNQILLDVLDLRWKCRTLIFLCLARFLFFSVCLDSGPAVTVSHDTVISLSGSILGALSSFRDRLQGFDLKTNLIVHICGLVATHKEKPWATATCPVCWPVSLSLWLSDVRFIAQIPSDLDDTYETPRRSCAPSDMCPCLTPQHASGWEDLSTLKYTELW